MDVTSPDILLSELPGVMQRSRPMDAAMRAFAPNRFSMFLDSVLEPFNPGLVAKRLEQRRSAGYHRAMLAYAAATLPGASYSRPSVTSALTSEEAQLPGYSRFQMIAESRDLYANNGVIRALVDGMAFRVVGTGLKLIPHTSDAEWNDMAKEQWEQWADDAVDCRGMFDLNGFLRQVVRSCFVDGDLGARILQGDDLLFQLVEGDLIAENQRIAVNIDTYQPMAGVVYDKDTGKPLAYMVGRRGPGGLLEDAEQVSANDFILLFRQQRVDQLRGVPLLAPVLQTARDLDRYVSATRVQANIAATYGVVVKSEIAGLRQMQESVQAQGQDQNGNAYRTVPLQTGKMMFMQPGESIETFKPDVPGPMFDPFAKFLIRTIAVGAGSSYEMVMQDYSDSNFSQARISVMDQQLRVDHWRRFLIRRFLNRAYCHWVARRMSSGKLPFNPDAFTRFGWQHPARLGVDPQKDAAANIANLTAGLDDWDNIYQESGLNAKVRLRRKAEMVKYIKDLAKELDVDPLEIASVLPPGVVRDGQHQVDEMKAEPIKVD